jgi:hypothetical protein
MSEFDDLPDQEKVALFRRGAKSLREGGEAAALFKPEYHEDLVKMFDDMADRIEAGEDPFEEEESPEQLRAQAETARKIRDLLEQEDVNSLVELFERYDIALKDELNLAVPNKRAR